MFATKKVVIETPHNECDSEEDSNPLAQSGNL